MASRILSLMRCVGRLTPERRALVDRAYVEAREQGKGDGEAADVALALLTDAEREPSDAHPVDATTKTARPRSRVPA
jgi:hypothetical protein